MRLVKSLFLASTLLASTALAARADVNVVASIKPVHSLVAAVMKGIGEPGLIVDGAGSPHTYAMKPSQAAMLQKADVVFWIGHELEAFLEKPLEAIASKAKTVELIDSHGLVKLKLREGGAFEAHAHDDHDDHGHDDHDKKAEKDHDDHGHDDHDKKAEKDHDGHGHDDHDKKAEKDHDDHGHDDHDKKAEKDHDGEGHDDHDKKAENDHGDHDHDDHAHGAFDVHVWLDPVNAKALVHEIEETLAGADPANAAAYEANAKEVMSRLDALTGQVAAELEPVKGKGFIVFHDAYRSFENRFGLTASGSITVSPEVMPGAERVRELRAKVKELGATCVFSEPQFEPKLISTVTEGTSARAGVLDPLGASIENGPDLYFTLIRNMATSFRTCMAEAS